MNSFFCLLTKKNEKRDSFYTAKYVSSCWLEDFFGMYLRDTAIIQHQHVDALLAALQEVMDLIPTLPENFIALSTMTRE